MAATTREELRRLLRERNEHPERLGEIDLQIRARFTERHAVLVLDMSGFSRLTMGYGIVHFLAMIERLHGIALPVVTDAAHGGRVVKTEADNLFAVFPDVPPAVRASIELHRRLDAANVVLPEDWDLHVSIGIGYGDLLMVGDEDMFGAEMNLASKLGEDLAAPGEILLTEAAFQRLPATATLTAPQGGGRDENFAPIERREETVSNLAVAYYRMRKEPR